MQVEDTRYYRVSEVAEHFSVSVSTIYRAIESGQLDAVRLGTAVRVPGWAVSAYTETCGQAAYDAIRPAPAGDGQLTPLQAEGLACVVCGADFLTTGLSHLPVGRSASGSQVFACQTHPEAKRTPSEQDVEDGTPDPEPAAMVARIEACKRRHPAFQQRTQGVAGSVGEVAR